MSPTAQAGQIDSLEKEAFPSSNASPPVEHPSSVHCADTPEKKADQLESGKLFAWFELKHELEAGPTGPVWIAYNYSPKRQAKQAALKFLPDIIVGDPATVEELKHEVRRRTLLKHPHIARFYDLVSDKGRLAVHMESVEGRSLSELRSARQLSNPISTALKKPGVDATREEVIKRINALAGASADKKTALIKKMYNARSMERLTVIRFDRGQTALPRAASDELVKAFNSTELRDKLSDPTAILVVAGYADPGGTADQNLRFSVKRAQNVSKILSGQLGLSNAIQTIGMGGTQLLDIANPDQNRAVEVWVVLPL